MSLVNKPIHANMPTVIVETSPADRELRTGTEWYVRELVEAMGRKPPEGVSLVPMKKPSWWRVPLWTHLGFGPYVLTHRFDLAFVPGHVLPLTARWGTSRWITTIHDAFFLSSPHLYKVPERRYLEWALERARADADLIIVPSRYVLEQLVQYGVAKERLRIIPHGVRQIFTLQNEAALKRVCQQYQIEPPFFIHVGRLDRKKDIPLILEAHRAFVRSHPAARVPIVFVGPTRDQTPARLAASYRDAKILGWCSDEDTAALMGAASALIFPGRYEGFGLPVLEAMACGTPVITSSGGATEEVAGDAAYLVTPGSVQELGLAMHNLVTDRKIALELHKRGLVRAREFTWEGTARATWQTITDLL